MLSCAVLLGCVPSFSWTAPVGASTDCYPPAAPGWPASPYQYSSQGAPKQQEPSRVGKASLTGRLGLPSFGGLGVPAFSEPPQGCAISAHGGSRGERTRRAVGSPFRDDTSEFSVASCRHEPCIVPDGTPFRMGHLLPTASAVGWNGTSPRDFLAGLPDGASTGTWKRTPILLAMQIVCHFWHSC